MQHRNLGRTKLEVSEIGFGAWGIGKAMWVGAEDDESLRALHTAVDLGLNFIDTALAYGKGHSERLIGQFLKERSERIYVATKVPPKNMKWPAPPGVPSNEAFPPEHVITSAEKSLKNLDVDCLDLLQYHVWNDEWVSEADWFTPIDKLKQEGKISHFGVSINDHQPENAIKLIETGLVDSVQVIFNIFDQSPLNRLFPVCIKNDIGVIVRVALDEGALSGKLDRTTTFPDGDFRNFYFRGNRLQQIEERVKQLEPVLGEEAESLPALALRFCLSFDAVSTVIAGMRSVEHVRANCALSDGRTRTPMTIEELKKHVWERNFYA